VNGRYGLEGLDGFQNKKPFGARLAAGHGSTAHAPKNRPKARSGDDRGSEGRATRCVAGTHSPTARPRHCCTGGADLSHAAFFFAGWVAGFAVAGLLSAFFGFGGAGRGSGRGRRRGADLGAGMRLGIAPRVTVATRYLPSRR
jgi:hypothetical protein